MKIESKDKFLAGILLGTAIGGLLGVLVAYCPSPTSTSRSFNYNGKLIVYTMEDMHKNQIYIEDKEAGSNTLVTLKAYLKHFTNQTQRLQEKSNIEKIVQGN